MGVGFNGWVGLPYGKKKKSSKGKSVKAALPDKS